MNPELLQTLLAHGATLTPTVGELLARESVNVRTPAPTEKAFQAEVIDLAKSLGWRHYHTHDSRKSAAGFPDLVLLRRRLVVAELKVPPNTASPAQLDWLDAFRAAGVPAYLWTPSDWNKIHEVLL